MPAYFLMCSSPSFAVAKFVTPYASLSSQNDSTILTRLFFLPRKEARGSVGDLGWLTTALPPAVAPPPTQPPSAPTPRQLHVTTTCHDHKEPCSSARLQLGAFSSPYYRCKQSSVWPTSAVDLIFHSQNVCKSGCWCVYLCTWSPSRASAVLCRVLGPCVAHAQSCKCCFFSVLFFSSTGCYMGLGLISWKALA